jgi:hypothetical protein
MRIKLQLALPVVYLLASLGTYIFCSGQNRFYFYDFCTSVNKYIMYLHYPGALLINHLKPNNLSINWIISLSLPLVIFPLIIFLIGYRLDKIFNKKI